ncbi:MULTISPECIES: hypothetical protein [Candidatus Ichthyocystis]|uniref:hypothetical protein n=1 Tax=Candidatus Ichthyocystis TaxID=2929841 RepID=UPI000B8175CE|nr:MULTISPECIES: hypothetical protein [Ichthyocystis]
MRGSGSCRFSCHLFGLCVFSHFPLLEVEAISAMMSPFSAIESGSSCRDEAFSNESTVKDRFLVCKSLNKDKKANKVREVADFM